MQLENAYVHDVYAKLATYTSGNPPERVWPRVKKFLEDLPNGSVILDVGKSATLGLGLNLALALALTLALVLALDKPEP